MQHPQAKVPEQLKLLAAQFKQAGHELWLVGGSVRDSLLGKEPKDIDLATSATPDEQIELYNSLGYRSIPTGITHGTITVVIDGESYEITTYRYDVETDGRHAVVAYTRDLYIDLERRDLTINAIAMSIETGMLADPYGGRQDLEQGIVRFVGEPEKRIKEDYLRILRWFRFLGRFSSKFDPVSPDAIAVRNNAQGLKQISVERVWSEIQKIITGPQAAKVVALMHDLGVSSVIGLEYLKAERLNKKMSHDSRPAAVLAGSMGVSAIPLVMAWKMSNDDAKTVSFIAMRSEENYNKKKAVEDLVNGHRMADVIDTLYIHDKANDARAIIGEEIPVFPLAGRDLVNAGIKPGINLGKILQKLKQEWIDSEYSLSRDELLKGISTPIV